MEVLAVEPWFGGSHRQFLRGLIEHSEHAWRCSKLPGRNWRWRMEMAAVELAREAAKMAEGGYRPDLIFGSSMLNLPAYLALTRSYWPDVPSVIYFHENQLTYPLPPGRDRDRSYWQINMLSALVADRVVFNSAFHRDNFLASLREEMQKYDDYRPSAAPDVIQEKSEILHIGLDVTQERSAERVDFFRKDVSGAPIILRNQRWDYDKNPEDFLELLERIERQDCEYQLILTGKGIDRVLKRSEEWKRLEHRILFKGFVDDRAKYLALLDEADIVVSTALHEFFGIAVMEAISRGCHPLLPRRLSYPELIPEALHRPLLHAPVMYDDLDDMTRILVGMLRGNERRLPETTLREVARKYSWEQLIDRYDTFLSESAHTVHA